MHSARAGVGGVRTMDGWHMGRYGWGDSCGQVGTGPWTGGACAEMGGARAEVGGAKPMDWWGEGCGWVGQRPWTGGAKAVEGWGNDRGGCQGLPPRPSLHLIP